MRDRNLTIATTNTRKNGDDREREALSEREAMRDGDEREKPAASSREGEWQQKESIG